jgi:hypothetical protein
MITAVLVVSVFNLVLQLIGVYQRHQTLKEHRASVAKLEGE